MFWEAERQRGVAKRISQFGGVKQGESVEGWYGVQRSGDAV